MKRALVFGSGGQIGLAVIADLLKHGWSVTAVARHRLQLAQAIHGNTVTIVDQGMQSRAQLLTSLPHTFDAIFEPTAYTKDDAADLLAARSRFDSIVAVSSCSVYADSEGRSLDEAEQTGFPEFSAPMTEDIPTVPPGPATYSTHKVAMENEFRNSRANVTILRPCAIYGPHAGHPREWWLVKRALDGRKHIPIAYDGLSQFHTISTSGIASLAAICMHDPANHILNVGDPKALTVLEIAKAIKTHLGKPVNLAHSKARQKATSEAHHGPCQGRTH